MYPETTHEQAEALLKTAAFAPYLVHVDGQDFTLTARLALCGTMGIPVDGEYVFQDAYAVIFEGGKWGPATIYLSASPLERIRAHWDGYIAAHKPEASAPTKSDWQPRVGEKVHFPRGMFGMWRGTVRRLYLARGGWGTPKGMLLTDITFVGANGQGYTHRRVPVSTLKRLTETL